MEDLAARAFSPMKNKTNSSQKAMRDIEVIEHNFSLLYGAAPTF